MVLLSRPRKVKPYLQAHTNPQGKCFGSSKTSHCSTCVLQVHEHQSLKVSPTPTVRGRVLPHGPFHQSNLIRWGGDKASLLLLWMSYISIWNYAIHLINLILLNLTLLCWLLHLDCVAETQRTQEQLLPFLKDRLGNQVWTNNRLSNPQ